MSKDTCLKKLVLHAKESIGEKCKPLDRLMAEIDFVQEFAGLFPNNESEWRNLIKQALETVTSQLQAAGPVDPDKLVSQAEAMLAPIGKKAKEYNIHCCGHAHIDMNWMWGWPETVNVSNDTFATVNTLMDEFPEFHFSQSQASTYVAMEKYCPEIWEMIKRRVAEGRWEVTASNWVEGDKNIVSGESLCRHLLYTRQFFADKLELKPEDVCIDWSPDTFGHAHTLPSIASRGGVKRYYHMRTGPGPWLYKWRSPDGSELLVFQDKDSYNGGLSERIGSLLCKYLKENEVQDYLYLYGVGDHGGGPTRNDLRKAVEMQAWPIFPTVKLSTTDAFFSAIEKCNPKLPVVDKDLNFIFEGCYTSQSWVKFANRVSEIALPEAETIALIAGEVAGTRYPAELILDGWHKTLFNHFHDILPGSGVRATRDYGMGQFQEILATTTSIKNRALRALASRVNTKSVVGDSCLFGGLGNGLGAGAGDTGVRNTGFVVGNSIITNTLNASAAGASTRGAGAPDAEPVLVFNPKPWERSETVVAKIWNKKLEDDQVVVRTPCGNELKGQVVERGSYWGHDYCAVAFRAKCVPALGYKVYAVDSGEATGDGTRMSKMFSEIYGDRSPVISGDGWMENEFLRVEIDFQSGAITHLIDKDSGFDYVQPGKLLGLLEVWQETPHGMTSWVIGYSPEVTSLKTGGVTRVVTDGPNRVAVQTVRKYNSSDISVEISLDAGSRTVNFTLRTRWLEIGTPETGIPMLRAAFPINVKDGVPTYEIPFGSQKRDQSSQEIPALKWADISGESDCGPQGVTLVNSSKYGHSCKDDILRLTLLRSSYDPDPLPEVADHEMSFAVITHSGLCDISSAIRAGEDYNTPISVVSATVQEGELPSAKSFAECLTPNVFVSAIKKAESSNALVIRLFEAEGVDTIAKVRIDGLVSKGTATEVDTLEMPVQPNTAALADGILSVKVSAFGQATVMVER